MLDMSVPRFAAVNPPAFLIIDNSITCNSSFTPGADVHMKVNFYIPLYTP